MDCWLLDPTYAGKQGHTHTHMYNTFILQQVFPLKLNDLHYGDLLPAPKRKQVAGILHKGETKKEDEDVLPLIRQWRSSQPGVDGRLILAA